MRSAIVFLLAIQCTWTVSLLPITEGNEWTGEWRVAQARQPLPASPSAVGATAELTVYRSGLHKIQCLVKYQHQSETFADGFESGDLSAWDGEPPNYFVSIINFVTCEGG